MTRNNTLFRHFAGAQLSVISVTVQLFKPRSPNSRFVLAVTVVTAKMHKPCLNIYQKHNVTMTTSMFLFSKLCRGLFVCLAVTPALRNVLILHSMHIPREAVGSRQHSIYVSETIMTEYRHVASRRHQDVLYMLHPQLRVGYVSRQRVRPLC